jgi:hypothetical protein
MTILTRLLFPAPATTMQFEHSGANINQKNDIHINFDKQREADRNLARQSCEIARDMSRWSLESQLNREAGMQFDHGAAITEIDFTNLQSYQGSTNRDNQQ